MILLIATSCSVAKKSIQQDYSEDSGKTLLNGMIREHNISNVNFKIDKAIIEIKAEKDERRIIANMKYNKPGIYLISIRNNTGIEAARLYITSDTVLMNDRINKKLYYGSPEILLKKYGISFNILPVLIGDYINEDDNNSIIECEGNKARLRKYFDKKEITYIINCSRSKLSDIKIFDREAKKSTDISFEKFKNLGNVTIPQLIKIQDAENEYNIIVRIEKIETVDLNQLSFIPGKNYEQVLLK